LKDGFPPFRHAFEVVAELQQAHPDAKTSWYQGLQPLVDNLAREQGVVDLAHKLMEGRLSKASGQT
jgi:hypothetical protein